MKKYMTLFMIVAMAFLFVGQRDSFAKTAQAASEELSKDRDGETYYQLRAPKTFKADLELDQGKQAYHFGRWFVTKIEAFQDRTSRFWHKVQPVIYKTYNKFIAVVD